MANIVAQHFEQLALNNRNYQTWVVDCEFHLASMQLSHAIAPRAAGAPKILPHEVAIGKGIDLPQTPYPLRPEDGVP